VRFQSNENQYSTGKSNYYHKYGQLL